MKSPYRTIAVRLTDEPEETQSRAGRYNPANCLTYRGRRFILACGDSDSVAAWSFDSGKRILAMSTNSWYGYAGIEELDMSDGFTLADLKTATLAEIDAGNLHDKPITLPAGIGESKSSAFFQNANEELAGELPEGCDDFFDLSERQQREILAQYLS